MTPSGLRAIGLLAGTFLCAALFTGCGISRTLLSLDSGYEKTRLPVHLDEARYEDERVFSVSVGGRQQDALAFATRRSVPVAARNSEYVADASLRLEADIFHYGLQIGASPTDRGLVRLGGYWGFQFDAGPYLVASLTNGFFANNSVNRTTYAHSEYFFMVSTMEEVDSLHGNVMRLEIPVRANLILNTGSNMSPFASYSFNRIGIGVRKAGAVIWGHELAAGTLVRLPRGMGLTVEGTLSRDDVVDREATSGRRAMNPLWGLYAGIGKRF
jgi:hypothetical protein